MSSEEQIVTIFKNKIQGKKPNLAGRNVRHDGREGHWLESQFGISANADNKSDILGYELKNQTTSKTTFGDWSANRYIFTNPQYISCFSGSTKYQRQNSFVRIFGKPNPEKGGRYSWSGSPCPKINRYNDFGQKLVICENGDIRAVYSFSQDKRPDKAHIVPEELQQEDLTIALWYGKTSPSNKRSDKCLRAKLEDKFNNNGWFTCQKDKSGTYVEICFGKPMNYDNWLDLVRQGIVFFDSGMYEGNKRPYSEWRAVNSFWESLIYKRYK